MTRNFLRVDRNTIVDGAGSPVVLRGVGLGGWMNMENFITGYPANESAMRDAVASVLGPDRADAFFERLLDRFFSEEDAAFLASLGVNCVRLPINQRHFEAGPFEWLSSGFERLSRAVDQLGAHGIHSVIDLHAVPGCQNQHWHSDNPTHIAAFWRHPHFMERATALWVQLAQRFADNEWVAGYNLLNEPADPTGLVVGPWHERTVQAIREVDPDHILFLDGNTYSTDFSAFGEPFANAIYACHDYAAAGMAFGDGRAVPEALEAKFRERTAYQRETGTPIWVGEFGPVYTGVPELDEARLEVLDAQLALYERYGAGWSLWTYKDVGLQGLVHASPDSPYMERFGAFIERKARLGIDSWGSTDRELPELVEPIHAFIAAEFPDWQPCPWNVRSSTDDLLRHILFAQAMLPTYAKLFEGVDDLDALADSFALSACVRRERLCEVVAAHTRGVSSPTG
jgi:aryl-phospho-beta-D-glucosidase BglC (GH1 family)